MLSLNRARIDENEVRHSNIEAECVVPQGSVVGITNDGNNSIGNNSRNVRERIDNRNNLFNCRNKSKCPLKNKCLSENIVYICKVRTVGKEFRYLGSTSQTFKSRFNKLDMSLNIAQVIEAANKVDDIIAVVRDGPIFYMVLNNKEDEDYMLTPESVTKLEKTLDYIES